MALASSDKSNQIVPKYEHSDRISFRRKALFPADSEDSNSDLGPMSPLSDTNADLHALKAGLLSGRTDEYVMLGESADESVDISAYSLTVCDTPSSANPGPARADSKSPSTTLLTPHDTSATNNQKIPRLSRKSQSEDSGEEAKAEMKNPKARTALFTEVPALPAKSFYPKAEGWRPPRGLRSTEGEAQKNRAKSGSLYLCKRRRRNGPGQINAGVRHGVRKPKVRSAKVRTAAMSRLEGARIVEYMRDVRELARGAPKQIKPLPKRDAREPEDKENVSPAGRSGNRSFKSAAPKPVDVSAIVADFDDPPKPDRLVLRASETVGDSENSIMLHCAANGGGQPSYKDRKRKHDEAATDIAGMLLSPTSQMCDMASEMAINSPKRAKLNINRILEGGGYPERRVGNVFNKSPSPSPSSAMEHKKLFPIFYGRSTGDRETSGAPRTFAKRWNKIAPDQMLLDAGQKRFGFAQCPSCELVYHMGDPLDERKHTAYHNGAHVLKFRGWKNERVVGAPGNDDRIVKVLPGDSKLWLKKVRDVMEVVDRELGHYGAPTALDGCAAYLYVKNKNVVGCAVAEPRASAYRMLSTVEDIDLCSEESYPVKCAVQRIWVAEAFRRRGLASAMMDCVRKNFSHGYVLRPEDVAVSTPTELGKKFAVTYFKTNNYLVSTM